MSTKSIKTIDDLGVQTHLQYEEDLQYFEKKLISESAQIAYQLSTDVFEPIKDNEFLYAYGMSKRGSPWGLMQAPPLFNQQKKRLFTYQLAPKLGPQELLDAQIDRIEEQRDRESEDRQKENRGEKLSWEAEREIEEINNEAKKLIELMQDIDVLNKIVQDINSERSRYKRG